MLECYYSLFCKLCAEKTVNIVWEQDPLFMFVAGNSVHPKLFLLILINHMVYFKDLMDATMASLGNQICLASPWQMFVSSISWWIKIKHWIVHIIKWAYFFYIIPMERGKKIILNFKVLYLRGFLSHTHFRYRFWMGILCRIFDLM